MVWFQIHLYFVFFYTKCVVPEIYKSSWCAIGDTIIKLLGTFFTFSQILLRKDELKTEKKD